MSERVALITGGARGIGRAVALDLATQGWSLAICYRTSAKEADETKAQIEKNGGRGLAEQCDVSDPGAAEGFVRRVEKEWGRIDALINGAGPYQRKNLLEVSIEDWHSMFDNNLHPLFYLGRAVAPGMKGRKWGADHQLQHGQRRPSLGAAPTDGALHLQSRRADLYALFGPTTGASRHHRQRDLPGIHRLRQRPARGARVHGQEDSRGIHRRDSGRGGLGPLSSLR